MILSSAKPGCCENEKTLQGKLNFLIRLWDNRRSLFSRAVINLALPTPKQCGFEFHMFTKSLFVTSRFPATWGLSLIKQPQCNSPWHYMTNCFPNVLPRCLFWFVTGQINSLSLVGSDSALPIHDHGWQLIRATSFVFLTVHSFDSDGCLTKAWKTNDHKSRTSNILETAKYLFGFPTGVFYFLVADYILSLAITIYLYFTFKVRTHGDTEISIYCLAIYLIFAVFCDIL